MGIDKVRKWEILRQENGIENTDNDPKTKVENRIPINHESVFVFRLCLLDDITSEGRARGLFVRVVRAKRKTTKRIQNGIYHKLWIVKIVYYNITWLRRSLWIWIFPQIYTTSSRCLIKSDTIHMHKLSAHTYIQQQWNHFISIHKTKFS